MLETMNTAVRAEMDQKLAEVEERLRRELGRRAAAMAAADAEFFEYVFEDATGNEFTNLAGGAGTATARASFRIAQSADFWAAAQVIRAPTQADETAADQPFTFRVTEQGGDLVWSNNFVHAGNGAGTAQRPLWFPKPYVFRKGSEINADYRNRTATAIRIYHSILGWKIRLPKSQSGVEVRA